VALNKDTRAIATAISIKITVVICQFIFKQSIKVTIAFGNKYKIFYLS